MPTLSEIVRSHLPAITQFRRELHQFPELSGQEQRTAARVAERLTAAGLEVTPGVGGHGVVAQLGSGAPCVALRADMDALPIQEQTGLPWTSQHPGVMHACGHDFHTAWLAGTALALRDHGLPRGTVRFIFQPAEETLDGAQGLIAAGVLQDPRVELIVGAHVWADRVAGQIGLRAGHNLAAADRFRVTLTGAGTHGASPHRGLDPLPAAAELVLALQTLVTRRLNPLHPAVVSVCQFHAGTAFNIIGPTAELGGTVRTVLPEDRAQVERHLRALCEGLARAHGLEVEIEYELGVPPTVADPTFTARAATVIAAVLGDTGTVVEAEPSLGAEDFAFYLEHCPGVLLSVGCAPTAEAASALALHSPCFSGADACLEPAMLSLAAVALDYLA